MPGCLIRHGDGDFELIALAGSLAKARQLVKDKLFRKVLHDAYVACDVPDDVTTRCAALLKVLPEDVVLSHWSGLWVAGLDVLPRDRNGVDLLDVTVPRDRQLRARPGVRVHIALVPDEEICEVNGLLIVSASRSVVDVARTYGVTEGVACGDAALHSSWSTL